MNGEPIEYEIIDSIEKAKDVILGRCRFCGKDLKQEHEKETFIYIAKPNFDSKIRVMKPFCDEPGCVELETLSGMRENLARNEDE